MFYDLTQVQIAEHTGKELKPLMLFLINEIA